ncbi:IS110 family transposase [Chroococcidiopsis sp. CCMEE 29]|uniref:IS110 family transposase n=2 Tax=Cyanobacteriota TaxID=1117 RepID=UPI002020E266|nr:IS110 family transposase [Chroococcidiopsis sp. CCMEE 29]
MTQSTINSNSVLIGIDTHKDTHAAVAINDLGARFGDCIVPATPAGYQQLLEWAKTFGEIAAFGVEGTGSYGKGLSQFLRRQGLKVIEVSRPCRRGQQRLQGKDDLLDAEDAARQVLAGQATAIPKSDEGAVEMIRILKAARDTAVKAQTQVMVSLKAMIVTADAVLWAELEPLSTPQLIKACQHLEVGTLDPPMATMRYALAAMAKRWTQLHKEIEAHTQHLIKLTQAAAPELVQAFGIGTDTAAEMLLTFGENADRVQSEAAFAKMCGVCPIPASSGKTQRHRLNRGGNRQANAALFRVVIVRMRWHEPTKTYVARRTAQGLSKREIIRCLKRYVAREIYHLIRKSRSTKKT